jgi:hypothetical protein
MRERESLFVFFLMRMDGRRDGTSGDSKSHNVKCAKFASVRMGWGGWVAAREGWRVDWRGKAM